MYSSQIIAQSIEKYETSANHKLVRLDVKKVEDWIEHLDKRYARSEDGEIQLTQEERLFIRNERVMSALDFRYWAERYAWIAKDGGGICKFTPWESQRILLEKIADTEQSIHEASLRGEPIDGILIVLHKARQLGATAVGRAIMMHGQTTQQNRRGMSASVDDDKIQELYDRDKLIVDKLPWWLRPEVGYDEKAAHIYFEKMNSRMLYQVSSQKSGLGVGRQFDHSHLTELSTWLNAQAVELDFFPTIPQSMTSKSILESTAYGRGNWWHDFTERVRKGHSRRWRYVFIPYYAELTKYRAQPPEGWKPEQTSLLHAQKVHDTSHEFVGHTVMLSKETLYWWESTRKEYLAGGKLNFFLTNYCATPEESFQHSTQSVYDPQLLESLRLTSSPGKAHEMVQIA